MGMGMGGGYRPKPLNNNTHIDQYQWQSASFSPYSDTLFVIKLPDPRFLLVLSRSLFLATVIITLPWIKSALKSPADSVVVTVDHYPDSGHINFDYWNLLWHDFAEEGLVKKGHKALILNSAIQGLADGGGGGSMSLNYDDDEIDVVVEPDLEGHHRSLPDEEFDFVFVSGSLDSKYVDRLVKIGGVIAMQLADDISGGYLKQSDYRIVYLKKYSSTIVAMRKLGSKKKHFLDSPAKRRLFQLTLEDKKAALKGLEDVLLEPPRRAFTKSHAYLKKMNFLPDLLGDSLEHYRRRVFIDVGSHQDKNDVMKWFDKNYPKRNQEFETYSLEIGLSGGDSRRLTSPRIDVSDWLRENAREEEYVVMKAEAEVVEELIEKRAISLVDELFLECNNQWQDGGKRDKKKKKKKKKKSKRAYWECLALYGRLRDEGVAVHQWWD